MSGTEREFIVLSLDLKGLRDALNEMLNKIIEGLDTANPRNIDRESIFVAKKLCRSMIEYLDYVLKLVCAWICQDNEKFLDCMKSCLEEGRTP